jgi:uncharacterized protein (TIGR02118 family)
MKEAKLIVIYPIPSDIDTFERLYAEEHVPMAVEKLAGKTRFVASTVDTASGLMPELYYRIAEVYFPSMQALKDCLASEGGQETAQHAVEISSGGEPLFLTAEVETFTF